MIRFFVAMALGGALTALMLHYGEPREAVAQQGPGVLMGCVYFALLPTLADKQENALLCDSSGRLLLQ